MAHTATYIAPDGTPFEYQPPHLMSFSGGPGMPTGPGTWLSDLNSGPIPIPVDAASYTEPPVSDAVSNFWNQGGFIGGPAWGTAVDPMVGTSYTGVDTPIYGVDFSDPFGSFMTSTFGAAGMYAVETVAPAVADSFSPEKAAAAVALVTEPASAVYDATLGAAGHAVMSTLDDTLDRVTGPAGDVLAALPGFVLQQQAWMQSMTKLGVIGLGALAVIMVSK